MKRNVWILAKALKEGKDQMKKQDYDGAREAILRAHDLYPQTEEINSILASCDSLQGKEPSLRVESKRSPSQLALPEAPSKPNTSPGVIELGLLASPNEPAREFDNGSDHNASDNTKLSEIEHPIPMPKEEFGRGQIWSVYFGKDRMPQAYVRLDARLSDNTIGVSLLEPMPDHDVEIRWKNQNLPISCGVFKVSEIRKKLHLSSFCCEIPFQPSKTGEFYRSFHSKAKYGQCTRTGTRSGSRTTSTTTNARLCKSFRLFLK